MQNIEELVADIDVEMRVIDVIKEGQAIRQGDLYLIAVGNTDKGRTQAAKTASKMWDLEFEVSSLGVETDNLQLVPGTSLGSRHIIREEDRPYVKIYCPTRHKASPLEGPTIVASGRFVVTHPEHAHYSLPEGTYQARYQRDFRRDQLARVED